MQLKEDLLDEGYICMKLTTVYEIFRTELEYKDLPAARSFSASLKRGQWTTSEKDTYGKPQTKVWIINEEKWRAIEHDHPEVDKECARVALRRGEGKMGLAH
jgi:hypothetical protein